MITIPDIFQKQKPHGMRKARAMTKEFRTMKALRTEHVRVPNIRNRSDNNMVERLHGTIRERNKTMRGLDSEPTAQTIVDGFRIYYNFIRLHMALNGKTPAEQARISKLDKNKWLSLIKKSVSKQYSNKHNY